MAKPQISFHRAQVVIRGGAVGAAALQSLAVASRARLVRIEARELDITV
jgi:hypothetical protein